jgi:hypothetical protein
MSRKNGPKSDYLCQCSCGKKVIKRAFEVRCGKFKSCGCIRKKKLVRMSRSLVRELLSFHKQNPSFSKPDLCLKFKISYTGLARILRGDTYSRRRIKGSPAIQEPHNPASKTEEIRPQG